MKDIFVDVDKVFSTYHPIYKRNRDVYAKHVSDGAFVITVVCRYHSHNWYATTNRDYDIFQWITNVPKVLMIVQPMVVCVKIHPIHMFAVALSTILTFHSIGKIDQDVNANDVCLEYLQDLYSLTIVLFSVVDECSTGQNVSRLNTHM
jgi:hypothetical protein